MAQTATATGRSPRRSGTSRRILTALASRNGNAFPRERVTTVLMGTSHTVVAHGTRAMPVWGPLFRMFESDVRTRVRIENLVSYLEAMQVRPSNATEMGKDLFRAYCATCHGVDGRGAGPMASELRRLPPSLTSYAVRNGGVFPGEQVRRIVDGRLVGSHGTSEMPVWGDARSSGRVTGCPKRTPRRASTPS